MEVKKGYVAVINPLFKKDSIIELTDDQKNQMMLENLIKLEKLEITHVPILTEAPNHTIFSEPLKVGDFIHVNPERLLNFDRFVDGDVCYIFVREGEIIFKYQ